MGRPGMRELRRNQEDRRTVDHELPGELWKADVEANQAPGDAMLRRHRHRLITGEEVLVLPRRGVEMNLAVGARCFARRRVPVEGVVDAFFCGLSDRSDEPDLPFAGCLRHKAGRLLEALAGGLLQIGVDESRVPHLGKEDEIGTSPYRLLHETVRPLKIVAESARAYVHLYRGDPHDLRAPLQWACNPNREPLPPAGGRRGHDRC